MYGGALFRILTKARTRVLTEISDICLHKNKVGGYACSDANMLLTQIERVLERKLFEDSSDGMKVLVSNISNALNEYRSSINIKKRDVLAASRTSSNLVSIDNSTVDPEITNNINAQDEADQQNVFYLTAIGVKEGITEGITNIVGKDITKPILRTTDYSGFKSMDQYNIYHIFTDITEGAEIPEATNIRRQIVNIAGKFFAWRETVVTNVERMAALAAKSQGYGVWLQSDL